MPNNDDPSEIDIHAVAMASALDRFQCSFPAIVTQAANALGRVTVQPAIRIRSRNGQQLTPKAVVIPVAWPSWQGYVMQGRLAPGDEVLVRCQDKNWLAWLESGGVIDDTAIGGHQSGYAVAEPIQLSKARMPGPLPAGTALRIGTTDGATTVVFGDDGSIGVQSGAVRLGASASPALPVARDSDPVSQSASLEAFMSAVAGFINAAVPGTVVFPVADPIGAVSATSVEVTST